LISWYILDIDNDAQRVRQDHIDSIAHL
jgi:hypothetical protein